MFHTLAPLLRSQQGASLRLQSRPAARFISIPPTKFREEPNILTIVLTLLRESFKFKLQLLRK
jgi:hypothetical protein